MIAAGDYCLFCHAALGPADLAGCCDYFLGTPFVVDYRRCTRCGLLQQSPLPGDVSPFYRAYPVHVAKSSLYQAVRKWVLSPVYFRPPSGDSMCLLDYGCGDGGYLESLKSRGLRRFGYEVDAAQAARVAQRLDVPVYADRQAMLERLCGAVDVVTMHFVVEHLTDLHGGFEDARQLLRTGGTFYFVVPQQSSLEARLFGRKWHGLDPPRHISFPEPGVVRDLAVQHGLDLVEHHPVPFANGFAGSLATVFTGRFQPFLFGLFMPAGWILAHLMPTGARAFVLRKQ
jgi:SAM-dependent methyltransferase